MNNDIRPIPNEINPFLFPKVLPDSYARWMDAVMDGKDQIWGVVRTEFHGVESFSVFREAGDGRLSRHELTEVSSPDRAVLCNNLEGTMSILWNEVDEVGSRIRHGYLDNDGQLSSTEMVRDETFLCLHPAIGVHDGHIWAVWSECDSNSSGYMSIRLSRRNKSGWASSQILSNPAMHAFRPVLVSGNGELLIIWDYECEGDYGIAWRVLGEEGGLSEIRTMHQTGERWMNPTAAVGKDGTIYVTWVVTQDVIDREKGIIDHQAGAAFAILHDGMLELKPDPELDGWGVSADLREGLLGEEKYVAYHGLRRRPRPVVTGTGEVWLVWEMRKEDESRKSLSRSRDGKVVKGYWGGVIGYLAGRPYMDGQWGKPRLLNSEGIGFAVPAVIQSPYVISLSLDQLSDAGSVIATVSRTTGHQGELLHHGPERWHSWSPLKPEERRLQKGEERVVADVQGHKFRLYWVDTHCHSVFSPDAEGEPDELIAFGRYVAGLDGMAIVDNDYYPHKSLSTAEWQIHQRMSRIFGASEQFVVLPAYEFTYHNARLAPDFNHRYVLFPGPGGPLCRRIDPQTRTIDDLMERLKDTEAITVAHHPTWELSGDARDSFIEVCSSWRVVIEETDFLKQRLCDGLRVAFIGSSDSHRACPGLGGALTGIYATELTPRALFEGYRARRTIASQGQRIAIDLRVGELFVGEEGVVAGPPELHLNIRTEEPLELVEIIRDGNVVARYHDSKFVTLANEGELTRQLKDVTIISRVEVRARWVDQTVSAGQHVYYVRVKTVGDPSFNAPPGITNVKNNRPMFNDGDYPYNFARAVGPFAWSSPIWATVQTKEVNEEANHEQ